MDAIQLTAELLRLRKQPTVRPIEHWNTHCVNCGVHENEAHIKTDCPPQKYETTGLQELERGK